MFLVPVKYCDSIKYIEVNDDDLNGMVFIKKALDEFDIQNRRNRKVKFIDQNGAALPPHQFKTILSQYKFCAYFLLRMVFTDENEDINVCVQRFKDYVIKAEGNEGLFDEEVKLGYLTEKSRKILFKHIASFIIANHTINAKPQDVEKVCSAVVEIFGSLKTKNDFSGGIDLLYDGKKRSGIIYQKLIYERRSQRKRTHNVIETSNRSETSTGLGTSAEAGTSVEAGTSNETDIVDLDSDSELDSQCSEDVFDTKQLSEFFGKIVLPRDENTMKKKLCETVAERFANDYNKSNVIFNLYLVLPSLVLFDFVNIYPDVDPNVLNSLWPTLERKTMVMYGSQSNVSLVEYTKNKDIHTLSKILSIFPTNRKNFAKALKSLLTISSDVNEDPMVLLQNGLSPHMIAIYQGDEWKYYIEANLSLFSIPPGTGFIAAFDFFYKIHRVFNLPFHPDFEQFMVFFDHYVYQIRHPSSTPSSKTVLKSQDILRKE